MLSLLSGNSTMKLRTVVVLLAAILLCIGSGFAQQENQLVKELLERARFSSGAPAVSAAIALNGRIVFSDGVGYANLENQVPAKGSTVYRIASISKPISAIAVMQLMEQGVVGLDDPIQMYVPSFPEKEEGPVTLLQLLTHTSGIRHYKPGEFGRMVHYSTLKEAIQIFKDDPLEFKPGTLYSYTTYGFNLLQGVVETAAPKVIRRRGRGGPNTPDKVEIGNYMRQFVWEPAGMTSTSFENPQDLVFNRARGYTRNGEGQVLNAPYTDVSIKYVGGGILSSPEDLVRVFVALDNGVLLKPETVQMMYKIHFKQGKNRGRGLGWAVKRDNKGRMRISHSGSSTGFLSMLLNFPDQGLVVAATTNCDWYSPGGLTQQIANIYLAALESRELTPVNTTSSMDDVTPWAEEAKEVLGVGSTAKSNNVAVLDLKQRAKGSPITAGWTDSHPFIKSSDGNFRMQFGGRLQLDWRGYTGTASPPSSFVIRRARLEAEGELFKHYEYKVQADFADLGSTLLRDAFVNINSKKSLQFMFGQFKVPFSQEELQSSKYIDFVERSSVNNLVPGRSPGMMMHGEIADGFFQYYIGVFNGTGVPGLNTLSTPESYLRLRLSPFKNGGSNLFKNFSFGGAFGKGTHKDSLSFRGRTSSRSTVFFRRVPVNGDITRANAEFWWRYKNVSLRGEYDRTHQHREGLGSGSTTLPGVIGKGYVVQGTYLLTGESKSEQGISPRSKFLQDDGGFGAWEVAFRYENLQINDAFQSNRSDAFTFGLNWWLTEFIRYQSNFVVERFKDPIRAPTPGDIDAVSFLSRMQVIF